MPALTHFTTILELLGSKVADMAPRDTTTHHETTAALILEWIHQHGVATTDQIPHTATVHTPSGPVRLNRRLRRVRKTYADGELPPHIQQIYAALPGWSWTPGRQQRSGSLPARAREWMRQHQVDTADQIPYSATLETDAGPSQIGRHLDNARRSYAAGTLPAIAAEELEQLPGWTWTPPRKRPPGQQRATNPT